MSNVYTREGTYLYRVLVLQEGTHRSTSIKQETLRSRRKKLTVQITVVLKEYKGPRKFWDLRTSQTRIQ